MKRPALLLLLLIAPALLHAEDSRPEASVQKKFVSGGTIRLHLEAGGYTVSPSDSDNITVTITPTPNPGSARSESKSSLPPRMLRFTSPTLLTTSSKPPLKSRVTPTFGYGSQPASWISKLSRATRTWNFGPASFRSKFLTPKIMVIAMLRSRWEVLSPPPSTYPKAVCFAPSNSKARANTACTPTCSPAISTCAEVIRKPATDFHGFPRIKEPSLIRINPWRFSGSYFLFA
jgi:hypothetical protein